MSKEDLYEEVLRRIGDKTTFGFNELRLDKRVLEEFGDDEKIKNTLELFSFGSLKDYEENKEDFVELSDSALFKLSQLTLISELLTNNDLQEFKYSHLKSVLRIQSTPDLERLITESIYSGILDAKLYNEQEFIKVYSSIGRDVLLNNEPGKKYGPNRRVFDLVKGLESFGGRVDKGLEYITEVKNNIMRNEDTVANTSADQSPTPETDSSSAQGNSSLTGGDSPISNKRKRPIDPK